MGHLQGLDSSQVDIGGGIVAISLLSRDLGTPSSDDAYILTISKLQLHAPRMDVNKNNNNIPHMCIELLSRLSASYILTGAHLSPK